MAADNRITIINSLKDSFKNLIYENIYNVLKDRESKQHHFVEDEISYFVRIRQRSIKKYKKQININNMIFNANNKKGSRNLVFFKNIQHVAHCIITGCIIRTIVKT